MPRPALCIGSTSYDIRTARRALQLFYNHLLHDRPVPMPALAAGEVDDHMWSRRQLDGLASLPQVDVIRKGKFEETGQYIDAPVMKLRKGATITADELKLFFTERADEAYPPFEAFCTHNGLDIPLLVGINTVDILLLAFGWKPESATVLLDAFVERTRRETEKIWQKTNGNVVFLIESPMATILSNLSGTILAKLIPHFAHHPKKFIDWLIDAFRKVIQALPQGAKWGFHFCFGRVGNKAMFEKTRASVYKPARTVDFSNLLFDRLAQYGLIPAFVHYPFRFGRLAPSTNKSDYLEYRRIRLPKSTTIFAGAIDPSLPIMQQQLIYEILDEMLGRVVGVAATCGYGSMALSEMEASLARMHGMAHCV